MSIHKKAGLIGTIEDLLNACDADMRKAAEANTEAGSYQGGTTHPVKSVDDRTEDAQEGARSAENTDDVKNEPNRGQTVDETTPGPGAGQQSVQTDIGMTSKDTGSDPSAETNSAKSGKQDPGSSHPARTDNGELDGHKYSSDYDALRALAKQAEDLGSKLCAAIADEAYTSTKRAEGKTNSAAGSTNSQAGGVGVQDGPRTEAGKVEAKDESGKNPAKQSEDAAAAGYDLAGIFANASDVTTEDKVAADGMVVDVLADVIALAHARAEKTAQLYAHFAYEAERAEKAAQAHARKNSKRSAAVKRAEGEEEADGAGAAMAAEEEGGEEGGDAGAALGAGGGGGEEAALMSLLAGGEDMGAEDALGGMAGAEGADPGAGLGGEMGGMGGADAGMGGADAGMGGMGGADAGLGGGLAGGAGGGAGGGMADPEQLAMIEAILQQEGIDPAELEAAMAGKAAACKRPAPAKKPKWTPKTAADRQKYAYMRSYIKELVGRSPK